MIINSQLPFCTVFIWISGWTTHWDAWCSCFLNVEKIYTWKCWINFLCETNWTSAMWFYSDEPDIRDGPVNVDIKFLLNLFYIAAKGKMKCFAVIIIQPFWVYSATYWKEKLIWTPLLKMVKIFFFIQIIINCELGLTQNYSNFIWVSDALERYEKLENSLMDLLLCNVSSFLKKHTYSLLIFIERKAGK